MDWSMVILLIVLISAVTSTIQTAIKAGTRKAARRPQVDDASQQEIRALKERVAVLERITTERSHSLEHEIERLRDR